MADYATLLRDHVTLKVRSIDRIFLQAYVPKLQLVGQVCRFLRWQKGYPIPSSAAFGKIGEAHVRAIEAFAKRNGTPIVHFQKGENKEERVRPLLDEAARRGSEGRVVLIGAAQERASAWRSWKAKGQEQAAHPHMEWGRQMAYINHYCFYLWDPEWGPASWRTNAYAPSTDFSPVQILRPCSARSAASRFSTSCRVRYTTASSHQESRSPASPSALSRTSIAFRGQPFAAAFSSSRAERSTPTTSAARAARCRTRRPGDYELRVSVTDRNASAVATRAVAFTIE